VARDTELTNQFNVFNPFDSAIKSKVKIVQFKSWNALAELI
jgi:hypothetical protein